MGRHSRLAASAVALSLFRPSHVNAHMAMSYPQPALNHDVHGPNPDTSPLNAGSKTGTATGEILPELWETEPVSVFQTGEIFNVTFQHRVGMEEHEEQARHGGGHCEFLLSYDQGNRWGAIAYYTRGCPDAFDGWPVKIPEDAPVGDALFAWSWLAAISNTERYMDVAKITIEGPAENSVEEFYNTHCPMIRANLPGDELQFKMGTDTQLYGDEYNNNRGAGPVREQIEKNMAGDIPRCKPGEIFDVLAASQKGDPKGLDWKTKPGNPADIVSYGSPGQVAKGGDNYGGTKGSGPETVEEEPSAGDDGYQVADVDQVGGDSPTVPASARTEVASEDNQESEDEDLDGGYGQPASSPAPSEGYEPAGYPEEAEGDHGSGDEEYAEECQYEAEDLPEEVEGDAAVASGSAGDSQSASSPAASGGYEQASNPGEAEGDNEPGDERVGKEYHDEAEDLPEEVEGDAAVASGSAGDSQSASGPAASEGYEQASYPGEAEGDHGSGDDEWGEECHYEAEDLPEEVEGDAAVASGSAEDSQSVSSPSASEGYEPAGYPEATKGGDEPEDEGVGEGYHNEDEGAAAVEAGSAGAIQPARRPARNERGEPAGYPEEAEGDDGSGDEEWGQECQY